MRAEEVVPALECLDGGLPEEPRRGGRRRERVRPTEPYGEREEAVERVGQEGAEELGAHEELVGDAEGKKPHVGVGLGHEGEEEVEGVADGAVGGAGRGLDGAEEDRVDGGRGGGGGALDEGRHGGLRRRGSGGGGVRAHLCFGRRSAVAGEGGGDCRSRHGGDSRGQEGS